MPALRGVLVAALLCGLTVGALGCTVPGLEPPNSAGVANDRGHDAGAVPDSTGAGSGFGGDGGTQAPTENADGNVVPLPPKYVDEDAGADDDAGVSP